MFLLRQSCFYKCSVSCLFLGSVVGLRIGHRALSDPFYACSQQQNFDISSRIIDLLNV